MYAIRSYYGKVTAFVDHILEIRREVDFGGFEFGEFAEHFLRQGRGAVLHSPGKAVTFPGNPREFLVITSYSIHYTKLYDRFRQ